MRSTALFAMLSATGRLLPVVFAPRIIAESERLPAFHSLTEIYFPLVLLAPVNIWDNLSRIFRDKGEAYFGLDFARKTLA